jgi:membrane-bound lytic murein transglycosylase B
MDRDMGDERMTRARARARVVDRAIVVACIALAVLVAGFLFVVFRLADEADATGPVSMVPVETDAVAEAGPASPAPDAGTGARSSRSPVERIDPTWTARVSAATGIPARALVAYAAAQLTIAAEQPACGIGWNTLAGIGAIESNHGRHGGAVLGADGISTPRILGPALNGVGNAAIRDTDAGRWDGDTTWDRAVGPLQFIPDTWRRWGADGNGDGVSDPNQIDDAALAAARYLCASGPMTDAAGWRAAIFSYNHLDVYVDDVAAAANRYARAVASP